MSLLNVNIKLNKIFSGEKSLDCYWEDILVCTNANQMKHNKEKLWPSKRRSNLEDEEQLLLLIISRFSRPMIY